MSQSLSYILFVCGHNAGRSQMGQAFFNHFKAEYPFVDAHYEAISSGIEPGPRLNPEVVIAMSELGIDMSDSALYFPKPLDDALVMAKASDIRHVILACDNECHVPAGINAPTQRWTLVDPYKLSLEEVREIRDATKEKVIQLLKELESSKV